MVRRSIRLLLLLVLVSAVSAGCTATLRTEALPGPRFTDREAGLSYALPTGWEGPHTADLVAVTSMIRTPHAGDGPDAPFAVVGAGPFDVTFFDPGGAGLSAAARGLAGGFADLFAPWAAQRTKLLDETVSVDAHPALHLRYRLVPEREGGALTLDLVAVELPRPAFLLAVVSADEVDLGLTVSQVVASLRVA